VTRCKTDGRPIKVQNGLPFWCLLTQIVLEKRPLNRYSSVVVVAMFRVENLEMSGNLKHVREMSGILLTVRELSGECQRKNLVRENCPKSVHY